MVNNVDEGNLIFWVLTNCGGMDEQDDTKFIERLKTTHVAHADGDEGAKATPQSIEAPFQGTKATIDMLTKSYTRTFRPLILRLLALATKLQRPSRPVMCHST